MCILQTRNWTSSVNVSPEYCTVCCTLCCFLSRSGCWLSLGMQGTVASEHSCLTWLYSVLFCVWRHVNGIHDATVVSSKLLWMWPWALEMFADCISQESGPHNVNPLCYPSSKARNIGCGCHVCKSVKRDWLYLWLVNVEIRKNIHDT